MNRIFVTADTHFGHAKVTQFRPFESVAEHDRAIVEKWNQTVKDTDTVWHLGDVYFGGKDSHEILDSLNGIKRLVLGNHDVYPLEMYQQYFSKIYGAAELSGCLLTHVPCHPNQLKRWDMNIHGHMHDGCVMKSHEPDERYFCASLERTGFAPVLLSEILQHAIIDMRVGG